MKKKIVFLSAGHSNKDSGAVSKTGVKEADLVVKFRNAVAHYLSQHNDIHLRLDGWGNTNLPLSEAVKLIDGSDVAIEFHMNAATSEQANGVESISLVKDKEISKQLSKAVSDAFESRLRGDNGWLDQSKSARGKLAYVSNGGIIVELAFISNPKELAKFEDKYWVAAKAVAEVILNYVRSK